ncbi:MAG: hypothetical protein IE931_11640 [Sphingobacteriales bacterium]|nr:hypothetical protein [Sphingobacteriales bacterium]
MGIKWGWQKINLERFEYRDFDMMTFEEFFLKKKIDLEDLAKGKPELFTEFRTHFEQMSEKSFDHTKKYWFNQLRHEFPLSEEKDTTLKEAFKSKDIPLAPVSGEIKELPSSPKPSGFKPRFKAQNLAESEKPKAESEESEKVEGVGLKPKNESTKEGKTETTPSKPAGFKPRFKAGQTQQAESEKPKAEGEESEKVEGVGLKAKNESTKEGKTETTPSKLAGFKPRFKAANLAESEKPKAESEESEKVEDVGLKAKNEYTKEGKTETTTSKPAGFKPRLKPKKKGEG